MLVFCWYSAGIMLVFCLENPNIQDLFSDPVCKKVGAVECTIQNSDCIRILHSITLNFLSMGYTHIHFSNYIVLVFYHDSARLVIVKININRKVEQSDGVQTRGGNIEETWQEHGRNMAGTRRDGRTDRESITKFQIEHWGHNANIKCLNIKPPFRTRNDFSAWLSEYPGKFLSFAGV